ncbi:13157_t:CDS:1 [Cetraspora pellucida]|uniref:13157_t:CDS:1 n=1 Tax=Cetraspora pellucida TaxID=1433469 RepID=A0A9N9H1Y7_9GLOM|nr:13157_t:CDS:1 [Cetraspora pellucida]
MATESFNNKQDHENPEQNDIIKIVPSFSELGLDEYDEMNEIIRQTIQELWEFWQEGRCICRKSKSKKTACFKKIGFYQFFKRQEECCNMSYNNLDTWIKGQLASFAYNDNSTVQNHIKYQYCYDSQHIVCLPTYLTLVTISSCRLDRIKMHIKNNGIAEIVYGNTERTSIRHDRAITNDKIKYELSNYLHNYANLYRFPLLGRNMQNYSIAIISLPINTTYTSIYKEYVAMIKSNKDENYKIIAYTTFLQI